MPAPFPLEAEKEAIFALTAEVRALGVKIGDRDSLGAGAAGRRRSGRALSFVGDGFVTWRW